MMRRVDETLPVAIWIESIGPAQHAYVYNGFICDKSADIRMSTSDRRFTFEFPSNPLSREHLAKFERLQRHGFTVIEMPALWVDQYGRPQQWLETLIKQALDQVMQQDVSEEGTIAVYDAELANEVLAILNESFPYAVGMIDIKHKLASEPSDDVLLTAFDALLLEGKIDGTFKRGGGRKLIVAAEIRITPDGRKAVIGHSAHQAAVIYGDQNINYGHAGAIGRRSTGTINHQQQWVANQVDLSQLTIELQTLRAELMKTAKTPADFQHLALVAEAEQYAEKQDGPKVMEVLSKSGKWLFDFATDVGTDITAKLLAKAMGLQP
jgi:hypothetical protein